jgi:site-specific DNA-methyltransferase (adenine-specific)
MQREIYSRTRNTIDEWETPKYFYELLNEKFKFTLDPCTDKDNWLGVKKFFTENQDGLKQNWKGEKVFVNPPFSNINSWVNKCYNEGIKENTIVVMIIPSRTDTRYWHNYVMKANEIWFCKGRVNFLLSGMKPMHGSTFPLAVIVFKRFNFGFPTIKSFYHKNREVK